VHGPKKYKAAVQWFLKALGGKHTTVGEEQQDDDDDDATLGNLSRRLLRRHAVQFGPSLSQDAAICKDHFLFEMVLDFEGIHECLRQLGLLSPFDGQLRPGD
jgi:hypothetical protein